jgi:hypothetical protein
MMKTKIVLKASCKKDAYCNREEYFKLYGVYDKQGCFKGMQNGAPLVINIDGSYYYYDKLVPAFGCITLDEYGRELKSPVNGCPPIFIWR